MKFVATMARECGINDRILRHVIRKEGIKITNSGRQSINEYQVELVLSILYFEGIIDHYTLPSKLNTM